MVKRMKGLALCMAMLLCGAVAFAQATPDTPEAAQTVAPNVSRSELPDFSKPQENDASSDELPDTNYALMEIDGEEHIFIMDNAWVLNGEIQASYTTYNPRGEVLYTLYIHIPSNMAPGDVINSRDTGTTAAGKGYSIYLTNHIVTESASCYIGFVSDYPRPDKMLITPEGSGLYIEITSRSTDWRTYTGVLSAMLIGPSARDYVLSNGEFHFVLTD